MAQIYEVKEHQSYARREKTDKLVDLMKGQLADGDTMRRVQHEQRVSSNFIRLKEQKDQQADELKERTRKQKAQDMKRILDIQIQERDQ